MKERNEEKSFFYQTIFFEFTFQENYTALHLAVEAGKHSVVETLLGQGAQVHIQGDELLSFRTP